MWYPKLYFLDVRAVEVMDRVKYSNLQVKLPECKQELVERLFKMTKRGLLFKLAGKNRSAQCNTKLFIVFVLLEKLFFEFMRCFLSSLNFSGKLN